MIAYALAGVAFLAGLGGGYWLARARRARPSERPEPVHRILLPFTGTEIARRALDAALRLARAEEATLMPAYLAVVPKGLPLDCALPGEADKAVAILEAIEQRATAQGVQIDARIERGRSYRHALAALLSNETFDRVLVPAIAPGGKGLSGEDLVWLLGRAPAEVVIVRPAPDDKRRVTAL